MVLQLHVLLLDGNGGSGTVVVRYPIGSAGDAKATGGLLVTITIKQFIPSLVLDFYKHWWNITDCEYILVGGGGGGGGSCQRSWWRWWRCRSILEHLVQLLSLLLHHQ